MKNPYKINIILLWIFLKNSFLIKIIIYLILKKTLSVSLFHYCILLLFLKDFTNSAFKIIFLICINL